MLENKYQELQHLMRDFEVQKEDISILDKHAHMLLESLLTAAYADQDHQTEYDALLEQLRKRCNCSLERFGEAVGDAGLRQYENGAYDCAQWIYRNALKSSSAAGIRNNLAYICRRHGTKNNNAWVEIIDLLLEGVKEQDTFSLINMALLFALELGSESDWKTADRLIALIDREKMDRLSAYSWWKNLADQDDSEGCLVCLWLNRHGVLHRRSNAEMLKMRDNVVRNYRKIPEWFLT